MDGSRNTNIYSGSCSHTNPNTPAWWMVDLEEDVTITNVIITSRDSGSRLLPKISLEINRKIFTARKRSLGQGNVFTSVCHSVHRGWCLPIACLDTSHRQTPPGRHPPKQTPPTSWILRDTFNKRAVLILLHTCLFIYHFYWLIKFWLFVTRYLNLFKKEECTKYTKLQD